MRLLQPEQAVWALVALIVVIGLSLRYGYKWAQRRRWRTRGPAERRSRWPRDVVTAGLAILTVLLLAAALTRPQQPSERVTPTYEKQDLVILLDRSVSMRARDIQPSRFGRAVDEIQAFLQRKPPTLDRIALVGFAGTSVVLSYPTSDLGSLFFYLQWVRDDPSVLFGTDMGAALETALTLAKRDGTQRLPPIFVLISDGDDQGTTLVRSAAALRSAGIRLYTVGVGSDDSVTIPVLDELGREELLRDDDGQVMRTRFAEGTMRRLAAMTGGQYFRSTGGGELLAALRTILDEERRVVGTVSRVEYADLYRLLLASAGVSLLLLVCLW